MHGATNGFGHFTVAGLYDNYMHGVNTTLLGIISILRSNVWYYFFHVRPTNAFKFNRPYDSLRIGKRKCFTAIVYTVIWNICTYTGEKRVKIICNITFIYNILAIYQKKSRKIGFTFAFT